MIKKNLNKYLINENENILGASIAIKNNQSRSLLVTKKKKILGVISEGDILNSLIEQKSIYTKIINLYQKDLKYLTSENLFLAFNLLKKFGISLIPVLSKNFTLKGIYTENYILRKIKINDSHSTYKSRFKKIKK